MVRGQNYNRVLQHLVSSLHQLPHEAVHIGHGGVVTLDYPAAQPGLQRSPGPARPRPRHVLAPPERGVRVPGDRGQLGGPVVITRQSDILLTGRSLA